MADNESFSLYKNEVQLLFSESSHRYKISDRGSKPVQVPSITTILNTLSKSALLPWAIGICCDYIEQNLRAMMDGGSIRPQDVFRVITLARDEHNVKRQEAADIGILSHAWLEAYWTSRVQLMDMPALPEHPQARNCVEAALAWFDEHDIQPLYVEKPVYSRKYKIAGRGDKFAIVDGQMAVIDYKSSNNLYPEVALQLSAYAKFYEEESGSPVIDRYAVKLGKNDGTFEFKHYPCDTLPADFDAFMGTFCVYNRLKELRRKPKKLDVKLDEKLEWLAELG